MATLVCATVSMCCNAQAERAFESTASKREIWDFKDQEYPMGIGVADQGT